MILDIVILTICDAVLLAMSKEVPSMWKLAAGMTVAYLLAECFLNYKMAILILLEHHFYQPKEGHFRIKSMDIEWSASGHSDSMIDQLYPKEMGIHRLKFICITDGGKRLRLRSATTSKKDAYLSVMYSDNQLDHVKVTYGPVSKIIFQMTALNSKEKIIDRISFFDSRL